MDYKDLDPMVIPMVEFFNSQGLKTIMSCQGHNKTNMSMFWIQFDKSVTKETIITFMQNHFDKHGIFCSCGRFANRIYAFKNKKTGLIDFSESWNYFAATIEAANEDLKRWKTNECERGL